MKWNNILITVDLEDWFQVENFKNSIPFSEWDTKEFRFENNTRRLLEIFEVYNFRLHFSFQVGMLRGRLNLYVRFTILAMKQLHMVIIITCVLISPQKIYEKTFKKVNSYQRKLQYPRSLDTVLQAFQLQNLLSLS